MQIIYDNCFDYFENDDTSRVFEILPNVFKDNRGSFSEVLKNNSEIIPSWLKDNNWIKQVNRSCSSSGVIRGFHAQKGEFCQAKLVEAINRTIYDVIVDTRPNSKTFGTIKVFVLSPETQNKLFVPRGFLHSFVVPCDNNRTDDAYFMYYCDNVYDKNSEICVNPSTVYPCVLNIMRELCKKSISINFQMYDLFELFAKNKVIYSEKDMNGMDYDDFISNTLTDFENNNKLWFKS